MTISSRGHEGRGKGRSAERFVWAGRQALLSGSKVAAATLARQADRWFLWTPVLFALGIGLYFAFPASLDGLRGPAIIGAAVLAAGLLRAWQGLVMAALAVGCIGLGVVSADYRTGAVAGPVLTRPLSTELTGKVIWAEPTERGGLRAEVAPDGLKGLTPSQIPRRIHLTFRFKNLELRPGDAFRARVRLMPPPGPAEPGGFDYRRKSWFEQIGATGFAYAPPVHVAGEPSGAEGWIKAAGAGVQRLRAHLSERIQEAMEPETGAIATALMTGMRRAIPKDAKQSLRDTGLAHILAISGLHMALFAGSLYWLVRFALAQIPALALNHPIKKWAAIIALAGAVFYLVLSGANIATQRAFIMIALMFTAILLGRPALTMRNVALAALIVLAFSPESLLSVSFQMSFAAVVALIAVYEVQQGRFGLLRSTVEGSGNGAWRWLVLAGLYLSGIALTSLVAGTATGAFAAFHFNRYAAYGLIANLAAMPLVGFVVMPCALAAFLLMPFGLEAWALIPMGWGIEGVLWVAETVAAWPGAVRFVPAAPVAALLWITFGGLWLCLWRGRVRFIGGVFLGVGILSWSAHDRPDLLVERMGKTIGILNAAGTRKLVSKSPRYTVQTWLRRDGDARTPKEAQAQSDHIQCDAQGCVYREPGRPVVAYAKTQAAFDADCAHADIVVSAEPMPRHVRKGCDAFVIDRFDVWRNGTYALWFERPEERPIASGRPASKLSAKRIRKVLHARRAQGNHPWAPDPKKR